MSEYHPDFDVKNILPMPKVKPTKDPDAEDNALVKLMSLAMFGATTKAIQDGNDFQQAIRECVELFKVAGLIK